MRKLLKRMSPARIIALGFAAAIFIGSGLLMLPCSVQNGVDLKYIDALYTSASAVCVTGLVTVDIGDTFTAFGQFVVAALIQIGGLGVASMGAGVILAVGKRINLKGRRVLRDAMNLDSGKGIVKFIKSVFLTTAARNKPFSLRRRVQQLRLRHPRKLPKPLCLQRGCVLKSRDLPFDILRRNRLSRYPRDC